LPLNKVKRPHKGLPSFSVDNQFLQRVSIACCAERCFSYGRFRPSVRPSQSGIMSKRLKVRSWGLLAIRLPFLNKLELS